MSSEWGTVSFAEAPFSIIDGDRGANYPKQNEFSSDGYCLFLNAGNVTANGFDFSDCAFVSKDKDSMLRKGKLVREDLVLTTRGTVGNVAYYSQGVPFPEIRINSGMVILRPVASQIIPRYLYLFLRSNLFKEQVLSLRSGSAQPQLPIRDMHRIEMPLPSLAVQNEIVCILGALDDRIALLRETNPTLEAIAQAMFKSWFVDFDPVRAKMEGRAPEGMDEATAALFPDSFEESELGLVPKGWRVGALQECCLRVESGGTPKRTVIQYWNGDISWLSSGEVRNPIVFATKEAITDLGLKESSAKLWPVGTTVVAMYGATAGEVCVLANPSTANQACCGLIPRLNNRVFLFFYARRERGSLAAKSSGSAQQNLNKGLVANHPVIIPSDEILASYESVAGALLDDWIENERQAKMLADLRDTLLPRLISGQLRLSELTVD